MSVIPKTLALALLLGLGLQGAAEAQSTQASTAIDSS